MHVALRTLRDGRAEPAAPAPLLLLRDSLAAVGGPALLRHAVAELAAAIAGSRAQAAALTVIALECPAEQYIQLCCQLPSLSLTVLDCYSDPYAWGSLLDQGTTASPSAGSSLPAAAAAEAAVVPLHGLLAAPNGLQQLEHLLLGNTSGGNGSSRAAVAQPGGQLCLVFDSLSPLLDIYGPNAVAQLLQRLAAAPCTACLLCGVHADLHPAAAVAAVEQLAAGSLSLQPVSELEREMAAAGNGGREPQGRLLLRLKRRNGRVRAEVQLYCIDGSEAVTFVEPPADMLHPAAAAADKAAASAAGSGEGGLAQQLAGGMKLSLSREEQEARQQVQLPFEHQGQGAAYQTSDWRDYLAPEAGGRAAARGAAPATAQPSNATSAPLSAQQQGQQQGQQARPVQQQAGPGRQLGRQLGRIMYVRDSGSEHDSDEDPDDDLDI